jgi:hypothetical protein
MSIPHEELERVADAIRAHPEYIDPLHLRAFFALHAQGVTWDPYSTALHPPIIAALRDRRPFSVVRIGDGEGNLLSYGRYPETPQLNVEVVAQIVGQQQDRFEPDEFWRIALRELLLDAVAQADIVGVLGLWRSDGASAERLLSMLPDDPRGISGHWRAIDQMFRLACQGSLRHAHIASAHLYFSIVCGLPELVAEARQIHLLTDRASVVERCRRRFPQADISHIEVGRSGPDSRPDRPEFLQVTSERLPADMAGSLSLVGAGPWAEIYCSWIKQRGGVAIDIGSGFDLLDGEVTRPVHRRLDDAQRAQFQL